MLEWQFQKRLQESKQSDEDEEEEDDEDVDTMMIMQRLEAEKRARVRFGWMTREQMIDGGEGERRHDTETRTEEIKHLQEVLKMGIIPLFHVALSCTTQICSSVHM